MTDYVLHADPRDHPTTTEWTYDILRDLIVHGPGPAPTNMPPGLAEHPIYRAMRLLEDQPREELLRLLRYGMVMDLKRAESHRRRRWGKRP